MPNIQEIMNTEKRKPVVSSEGKRFFWDDTERMEVVMQYPHYYVRGLPFRKIKRVRKDSALSFLKESLAESLAAWARSMERLVAKLSGTFILFLEKRAVPEIQKTIAQCEIKMRERFTEFHKSFIDELIRKDQIAFRRGLYQQMKDKSSEIFRRRLREHVGSLVLKAQEDTQAILHGAPKQLSLVSGQDPIPHGARFIFKKGAYTLYVIEQEPQMRTISFKDKGTFRLAFPYVVFVATLYSNAPVFLHVFFRNTALQSVSDNLYCPALSNVSENTFIVCFPLPGKHDSQQKTVEDMVNNFWGSPFYISDLASCFLSAQSSFPELSSLSVWEENSRMRPQFALSINWHKTPFNISGVVDISIKLADEKLKIKSVAAKTFDSRSIEAYADTMAIKLGEEIQEALFFLAHYSHIDTGLLAESQNAFKKLCEETGAYFTETLGGISRTIFSEKELVRVAGDVLAEARALESESKEDVFVRTLEKRVKEIMAREVSIYHKEEDIS